MPPIRMRKQRFRLAHELAHFLRDYWNPCGKLTVVWADCREVLDGLRLQRRKKGCRRF